MHFPHSAWMPRKTSAACLEFRTTGSYLRGMLTHRFLFQLRTGKQETTEAALGWWLRSHSLISKHIKTPGVSLRMAISHIHLSNQNHRVTPWNSRDEPRSILNRSISFKVYNYILSSEHFEKHAFLIALRNYLDIMYFWNCNIFPQDEHISLYGDQTNAIHYTKRWCQ